MSKLYIFFIIMLLCNSLKASAKTDVFPLSTEMQIGKIRHMVEDAPQGLFLTVGSERGFRGASMAHNIQYLMLVDVSDTIVRFNQINKELLKAQNKELYKELRWNSTFEAWHKVSHILSQQDFEWWVENVRNLENSVYPLPEALNKFGHLPFMTKFVKVRNEFKKFYKLASDSLGTVKTESRFIDSVSYGELINLAKIYNTELSITKEDFDWWHKHGKDRKNNCSNVLLNHPEQAIDLGKIINYKDGNYLFDDKLYAKLHQLAKNEKIVAMKLDLSKEVDLEQVIGFFKHKNLKLSVFDGDNLYFHDYIGNDKYKKIINNLLPYGNDNSMLITMANYKDYACGQFQVYVGFTFDNIKTWPSNFDMEKFYQHDIGKDRYDLIDGKVYGKADEVFGY